MEEEEAMIPPFWLQSDGGGGRSRRLRRSHSLFLSSGVLLVFLLVTACVCMFIVVPTLLSFTSHIFKPHLVKKSWDSLNLVLVLFAIVCGFLSRNTNETPRSYEDRRFSETPSSSREFVKSNPETPRPWYVYSESDRPVRSSFHRLRSFNSYPDLRQESPWIGGEERWRFHDDTHVSGYRGSELDEHRQIRQRQPETEVGDEGQGVVKNIAVDTFEVRAKELPSAPPVPESRLPPPSPPPRPPSPPPQPVQRPHSVRRNAKRTYQAAGKSEVIEKMENNEFDVRDFRPPPSTPPPVTSSPPIVQPPQSVRRNAKRTYSAAGKSEMIEEKEDNGLEVRNFQPPPRSTPPPPPPPPPPPLSPFFQPSEKKTTHSKKKRGSATKEFLTSLKGKKKKQRQKSVENFETILNSQASHSHSQPPPSTPPPPPPPPPPPSVFHNLFSSRKSKHKRSHSVPQPVPAVVTHKPHISYRREIFHSLDDNVIVGNESPLIPIPPPPPLPPFKMPAWKFRVQGDFVRIDSIRSSRSSSPDIDEGVDSPTNQEQPVTPPLFCPSPDVDTKADTFIARFRAGLKLEKMNSMKEKQGIGKSNLGPSSLSTETREETGPE